MKNYLELFTFRLGLVMIVALFVTELGSLDSMVTRLRSADFYKEYLATGLISVAVFELVFNINKRLDRNIPWHGQVFNRLMLQIMLGWIGPLFFVFGLAALYFFIYDVDIMRTDYLYYGFPFVIFLLLLLNIVIVMTPYSLIGLQHMKIKQATPHAEPKGIVETREQEQVSRTLPRVKVQDGNTVLMLEPAQILASYIVNGRVVVKDSSKKEYLTELTLDQLEKEYLPREEFFRINRQLIAANAVCQAYNPLEFGKLAVELEVNVPVEAVVSQLKAKSFKEWIDN